MVKILAIETSCDETAAAVVEDGRKILSNVVASQVDLHKRFGGVVPEIASRSHQEVINPVIKEALETTGLEYSALDALAVTLGPGLPGALIVGVATAKAIAYAIKKPLIGVNHLEGHLFANYLQHPQVKTPLIALIVSGGHTLLAYVKDWGEYEVLGQTLDDAAGEAFDKIAKFLGMGYPGGAVLSKMAETGDPRAIDFPRAMMGSGDFNFSLSGLKTAVINYITKNKESITDDDLPDICASFEAAIVDVQVSKSIKAAKSRNVGTLILAGGVAANNRLRSELEKASKSSNIKFFYPSISLCTDNAAMIASAAYFHYLRKDFLTLAVESQPNMGL